MAARVEEIERELRATVAGPSVDRGWRELSPFRGTQNPLAPPMDVAREVDADGAVVLVGTAVCGPLYEGPPGAVHGGHLAGLFDDLLGACVSIVGGASVTGRLTVRYRRPTPLHTELRLEARATEVRSRRILGHGVCLVDGVRTAEAEGLFLRHGG